MQEEFKKFCLRIYDCFQYFTYLVSPEGILSTINIYKLKNKYRNKRCFIIGNGPSLARMDLSFLKGEYTFGLNRIYLLFKKIGFKTTFLVSVNDYVIQQFAKDFGKLDCVKFFSWRNRKKIASTKNTHFIRSKLVPGFSKNPGCGVWEGTTVTFVAMQLAYYLGFSRVILIGVDHSFKSKGKAYKLVTSKGKDVNHFDPNYFGKGTKWQLPDLETSELAYKMAKKAFELDNREVLDATIGGKLKVYKKIKYKTLFNQ